MPCPLTALWFGRRETMGKGKQGEERAEFIPCACSVPAGHGWAEASQGLWFAVTSTSCPSGPHLLIESSFNSVQLRCFCLWSSLPGAGLTELSLSGEFQVQRLRLIEVKVKREDQGQVCWLVGFLQRVWQRNKPVRRGYPSGNSEEPETQGPFLFLN